MLEGILIGAGSRGAKAYAPTLLEDPGLGRIVALAEPREERRCAVANRFGVADDACFSDWRELLDRPRRADFAIIATPDHLHVEPAVKALERGYAVLLEKPMAPDPAGCERLLETTQRTGGLLQICHVLRYAPLFARMHEIVAAGELGEPVTIQHSENVSTWHHAHSYVRGPWRNADASAPMILTKSCHDLDLLFWLAGAAPRRLTSLARPTLLGAERAPEGAPERCIEGCAHAGTCPYDAVAMYQELTPVLLDAGRRTGTLRPAAAPRVEAGRWANWPVDVISESTDAASVEHALRTSRYGRCVYRIEDHDQPASQNVDIEFRNGVHASFTLHTTSDREGRETRIDGTRGTLRAGFYTGEQWIEISDHKTGAVRRADLPDPEAGHGGADARLFADFLAAVRGESEPFTSAAESLWSHRMAFAADRAAREHAVVEWPDESPRTTS